MAVGLVTYMKTAIRPQGSSIHVKEVATHRPIWGNQDRSLGAFGCLGNTVGR